MIPIEGKVNRGGNHWGGKFYPPVGKKDLPQ